MLVKEVGIEVLREYSNNSNINTVFTTTEWVKFLEKNQKIRPVILEIINKKTTKKLGYFVGMISKKMGVKIFGSPFEGWLTPDMGFIRIEKIEINKALKEISRYAFKNLGVLYIQINDKSIKIGDLNEEIKFIQNNILEINIERPIEKVLENFTKNGRRDVRASSRKEVIIKKVKFNKKFADIYYNQLIEVFEKQSLEPFYDKNKIYDLVEAYKDNDENVLALAAYNNVGICIGTVLSFGMGEWAYYLCAASYREYQKQLPNEALFWEFVKYWHEKGIKKLDLVGYRKYKMKYNPDLIETPTIYFEKIPGLLRMKNLTKNVINIIRKIQGKIKRQKEKKG